jgi:hypothetical protein
MFMQLECLNINELFGISFTNFKNKWVHSLYKANPIKYT